MDTENAFKVIRWDLAKWTRNSMQESCPWMVWRLYARIDRFRWTYMRHYCDFANNDCSFSWAMVDKNGEKRPSNFRLQNWFNKRYGSSTNPLPMPNE